MSEIVFHCRKCGTCCRSLLEYVNGVKTGLLLAIKETNLFPSEMVSPKLAVGTTKPEAIISYQLNVDACPYISEKNECRVYDKRPLICKSFPYVLGGMSRKCPQIGNQMMVEIDLWAIDAEIEASKKLNEHILNRAEKLSQKGKRQRVWEFDLEENKWIFRRSLS
jgi:Fe-S-cluster containining protein